MHSLVLENLSYRYDGEAVVDSLNLTVEQNEIVCLLGASGCGKTTTLKAIAGLIEPFQGSVSILGKAMNGNGAFVPPQKRNIGMMFQDYALFPYLTVAQNVAFGLTLKSKRERQDRVAEMLHLVQLQDYSDRFPHELSGGQQQRVAIARALAYKPNLLLLDEPFSNIDAQVRFQLINDIRRIIKDQQVSAIFVSHSKEEAFAFADRLAIMDKGKIAQVGEPRTLFQRPKSKMVAEFLGQGIYIPAQRVNGASVETQFGAVKSLVELGNIDAKGEMYVRPQHITLENAELGSVKILNQRFMGTEYIYRVALEGQELEVPHPAHEPLDLNQPISLKIKAHAVNFFS
ncbi:ABC transporter ATP-binding protein [Pseudoalteromonas piscicida]|uniref:Iron(III) transport system ATP-binding protein n=1 Tax=Pseudoalteromonas piscicida TaxID=43662 RepID=A0ABM6NEX2_PSEO7|nr:ABC transporter ATP-binding protein [Pseudoalteromonas piscicida]ATD07494.1 iron(III) transport system ATP-binding protein [Pseudoalteromonas piscicida]WPU34117.1 ABC transporter ATP-binding protein [Pseudoalteromonas piscicida]